MQLRDREWMIMSDAWLINNKIIKRKRMKMKRKHLLRKPRRMVIPQFRTTQNSLRIVMSKVYLNKRRPT
jgi:hypothetical protein